MPSNRADIIADIEQHIRKLGGAPNGWCVVTAKDSRGPFFQNHLVADLNDGLIYREAFTLSAAQAIRDHFVNDCGLEPDEAERGSALPNAAPEPGTIISLYRRTAPDPSFSGNSLSALHFWGYR
jgi:hypothetical protein